MRNTIFTTFSQLILSSRLLLVVMNWQKSNLSCKFKFEPIIIYHLWFIMKILWKFCEYDTSLKILLKELSRHLKMPRPKFN